MLVAYQNEEYAQQYRHFVARVRDREQAVCAGNTALAQAAAKYLDKLMAYKDEYEVARLYTDGDFLEKLGETFEDDYQLTFHMAPPIFNRGLDVLGRPKKRSFGPWMLAALQQVSAGDVAYQGLATGLEEDAAGWCWMASKVPEMLVASSCSKNFGLYRERTGAL